MLVRRITIWIDDIINYSKIQIWLSSTKIWKTFFNFVELSLSKIQHMNPSVDIVVPAHSKNVASFWQQNNCSSHFTLEKYPRTFVRIQFEPSIYFGWLHSEHCEGSSFSFQINNILLDNNLRFYIQYPSSSP